MTMTDNGTYQEWEDAATGYLCAIHLPQTGINTCRWFCGYVRVPKDHPWYEIDYSGRHPHCCEASPESLITVHGGLTYSGRLSVEPEGWWFGFDCAHLGDYVAYGVPGVPDREGHHWTIEEVESACALLAAQLRAVADAG